MGERQRRGRIAGDHDKIGCEFGNGRADHRGDTGNQRILWLVPIREPGIVGEIDKTHTGNALTISRNTVSPPTPESKTRTVAGLLLKGGVGFGIADAS